MKYQKVLIVNAKEINILKEALKHYEQIVIEQKLFGYDPKTANGYVHKVKNMKVVFENMAIASQEVISEATVGERTCTSIKTIT